MKTQALDHAYISLMRPHPYGKALYKPPTVTHFHPGSVGYFNIDGDWCPFADFSAVHPGVSSWPRAFTPPPSPDQPPLAPPETETWGPMVGQKTTCRSINLTESVSLTAFTGVPLAAGSCFRFETGADAGAVLLTKGPVAHQRYLHEAPFKQWVAKNAKPILQERPEVREYGLWVVTSTWTASEAAFNCWSGRHRAVDVGFNVQVAEIGELAPKAQWFHSGSADGWVHFKAPKDGDEKAIFFGGLYFSWRKIIGGPKHKKIPEGLRGAPRPPRPPPNVVSVFTASDTGDRFEVFCDEALEDASWRPGSTQGDDGSDEYEEY